MGWADGGLDSDRFAHPGQRGPPRNVCQRDDREEEPGNEKDPADGNDRLERSAEREGGLDPARQTECEPQPASQASAACQR